MGLISLQVTTKVRNAIKGTLTSGKLQVICKSQRKLSNKFRFKDCVPYKLASGVVYEYTCGRYGVTERHFKVSSVEDIGIQPFTFKNMKLSKEILIGDHLLQYDNNPSFDEFTILTHNIYLKLKKSILIKHDQPEHREKLF